MSIRKWQDHTKEQRMNLWKRNDALNSESNIGDEEMAKRKESCIISNIWKEW